MKFGAVEQAISELGFVSSAPARLFRCKRTRTEALVLSDITDPFFTTIARGVEDFAATNNFAVMFCYTDESEVEERECLQMLIQRQKDGVLSAICRCGLSSAVPLLRPATSVKGPPRRPVC